MLRIAFAFAVLAVATAHAADSWVGQKVFWKDGARLKVGEREVDSTFLDMPALVTHVSGAWLWTGQAWLRESDALTVDQALDFYTEQITQKPSNSANWLNRGIVWHEKGELDNAIKDYTEAIRLGPQTAVAYSNRGWARQQHGDYGGALSDYSAALKIDPQDDATLSNAAWLRATCLDATYRDGAKSLKNATRACELSSWKDWASVDTLAAAYAEKGDFDQAVKWQAKAIELATASAVKAQLELRLDLYKAGKPYREEPKAKTP